MVLDILRAAATNGVYLYIKDGRLAYKARTDALTDDLKNLIAKNKEEIIRFLLAQQEADQSRFPEIKKISHELTQVPLSFAQQRLWLQDQIDGGSAHYNMSNALHLTGALNYAALNQSFSTIVERHESLRTRFIMGGDGQPLQVVQPPADILVAVSDLSAFDSDTKQLKLSQLMAEEAARPFDLSGDLMLRAHLFKMASDEHVLLVTMHHIASDGWSIAILVDEFRACYSACVQGLPNPLAPLAIQYADYAYWQRQWLQGDVLDKQLNYWLQQLTDLPLIHSLPIDYPRPTQQSFNGKIYRSHIPQVISRQLTSLCQTAGATLFMGLQAAFSVLLSRYSNETDIVMGTPVANREQGEIAGLIGFFVNTLVLRTNLSGSPSFSDLLAQSKAMLLDAYAHQQLPFEQLVNHLQPERKLNHSPLFQIMLVLQNNQTGILELPGLSLAPIVPSSAVAKYDLTLTVNESEHGLQLEWEYSTDLFSQNTIAAMANHFSVLLSGLVNKPEENVFAVNFLTEQEQECQQQFLLCNPIAYQPQNYQCIHELFEAQVERSPEAIAVTYEGEHLTYAELNRRANQLAHFLINNQQIKPDSLVGICLDRSLAMVTAMMAVLKAGGCYVPIDPAYPAARLNYLLNDAKPSTVLTQTHLCDHLANGGADTGVEILCIDAESFRAQIAGQLTSNIPVQQLHLGSHHLAYVIYTSGSTGNPKGVMVEHGNVTRLMTSTRRDFEFSATDVWTMFHSYAFDFSVWEIWGALAYGGRLLVVPYWISRSPADFYQLLADEKVTVLNQTPSAFNALILEDERKQQPLALRYVIFGGEALNYAALIPWCARHGDSKPQLINMYGITETTVHVTYRRVTAADLTKNAGTSFIGKPLADLQVLVLNSHKMPVPAGVAGELYVGGAGVARGYWNQTELTNSRFLLLPEYGAVRFYRSGDLARQLANGELEYLGRIDQQVKIRGFRIELGEIEHALAVYPQVTDALVLAKTNAASADKYLVAYVLTAAVDLHNPRESSLFIDALKKYLSARLPDYMVPPFFVLLDKFPLTTNGKVDTNKLPEPDSVAHQAIYVAPSNQIEQLLCDIWQEVLGIERVGVSDNFFQLGGHSLLVMQVLARLQQQGFSVTARQIFSSSSLQELAVVLANAATNTAPAYQVPKNLIPEHCTHITPEMLPLISLSAQDIARILAKIPGGASNVQDIYPLVPLQEGILFHHMVSVQGDPYVLPSLFKLQNAHAVADFIAGLQLMMNRHDVLRTAIVWRDLSTPVQVVCKHVDLPVTWLNLAKEKIDAINPAGELGTAAQMHALCSPGRQWMDLEQAPLLRLQIAVDETTQEHFVLLQYHHIISDHVGLEIIQRELSLYQAGRLELLPKARPYREFVAYVQHQANKNNAEIFFKNIFSDVDEPTLAFNLWDIKGDGSRIVELQADVPASTAQQIRRLAKNMKISPAAFFHTAWAMVIAACSGRNDVVFGTVLSGRLQGTLGVESMLGVFINTLPVRVKLGALSAIDVVHQVQQALLDLLPYEQASLSAAQRATGLASGVPLFNAILNYRHSTADLSLSSDGDGFGKHFELLAGQERTNYPVTLSVDDFSADFSLNLQVDCAIEAERVLAYMQTAVNSLTHALAAELSPAINTLDILPASESHQLLVEWNKSGAEYPHDLCIHELFEAQVACNPDAIAVVFGEQRLTYGELNTKANQLANYLIATGKINVDTLVGVCMERSADMVIAILAILKAGGAYMPLDPDYPKARLSYMLTDAQLDLVISLRHLCTNLELNSAQVLCLDDDKLQQQLADQIIANPQARNWGLRSHHLAYVIYTSGSTGNPKGVMVEHRSVVRLVKSTNYISLTPHSVIAQASNMSFDAMTFELWGGLLNGGRVVYIAKEAFLSPINLQQIIIQQKINTLFMTTALFNAISLDYPTALENVDYLLFGGEDCSLPLVQRLAKAAKPKNLLHVYGPTENTTFSLWKKLEPDYLAATKKVALGKPLSNTTAYVLTANNQLAPIGVVGELHLGGAGLARGYLNRPELTAEKFIANPLFDPADNNSSAYLYKTGDLVRWLPDGDLEFIGRIDQQVKIRGFRIELSEIEHALIAHAEVKDALVIARDANTAIGDKRLVAYVIANTTTEQRLLIDSLGKYLRDCLPDYMLPSAFVLLDQLPLTANGKVDRKALPEPDLPAMQNAYVAPVNETEIVLCELWQEILGVERVGVTDNFFQLGGHSLLATRLVARINHYFEVNLPLVALFNCEDLRALANLVVEHTIVNKNNQLEKKSEEKLEVEW